MFVFDIVGLHTSTFDFKMGYYVCYAYVYMLNSEKEKRKKTGPPNHTSASCT